MYFFQILYKCSTRINQSIDLLDTLKDKNVVEKMKTSMRAWVAKSFVSLEKTVSQFKTLTAAAPSATASVSQINIISNSQVPSISNTTTVELCWSLFENASEHFLIQIVIWLVWKPDDFKAVEHITMSYVFKSQGFLFLLMKFHEWRNHWRSCPTVFFIVYTYTYYTVMYMSTIRFLSTVC